MYHPWQSDNVGHVFHASKQQTERSGEASGGNWRIRGLVWPGWSCWAWYESRTPVDTPTGCGQNMVALGCLYYNTVRPRCMEADRQSSQGQLHWFCNLELLFEPSLISTKNVEQIPIFQESGWKAELHCPRWPPRKDWWGVITGSDIMVVTQRRDKGSNDHPKVTKVIRRGQHRSTVRPQEPDFLKHVDQQKLSYRNPAGRVRCWMHPETFGCLFCRPLRSSCVGLSMAFDFALIPLSPTVCFFGISWHILVSLVLNAMLSTRAVISSPHRVLWQQCTSGVRLQTSFTQLVLSETKNHQDLCEVLDAHITTEECCR